MTFAEWFFVCVVGVGIACIIEGIRVVYVERNS